jgi:hypothetical protein
MAASAESGVACSTARTPPAFVRQPTGSESATDPLVPPRKGVSRTFQTLPKVDLRDADREESR